MINKKKVGATLLALVCSLNVATFGKIPNETVIIGDKAYDLGYTRDIKNFKEILKEIKRLNFENIYIKGKDSKWYLNETGELIQVELIPEVSYKDMNGKVRDYAEKDGDEICLRVLAAKFVENNKIEITFNKKLSKESSENLLNYKINGKVLAQKEKINLQEDGKTLIIRLKDYKDYRVSDSLKRSISISNKVLDANNNPMKEETQVEIKDNLKEDINFYNDFHREDNSSKGNEKDSHGEGNGLEGDGDNSNGEEGGSEDHGDNSHESKEAIEINNRGILTNIVINNKNIKNKSVTIGVVNEKNEVVFLSQKYARNGQCKFTTSLDAGKYNVRIVPQGLENLNASFHVKINRNLAAIEKVEKLIDILCNKPLEELTLEYKDIAITAKAYYEVLTEEQKGTINRERVDRINESLEAIKRLEEISSIKPNIVLSTTSSAIRMNSTTSAAITLNNQHIKDRRVTIKIYDIKNGKIHFAGQDKAKDGICTFNTQLSEGTYGLDMNILDLLKIKDRFTVGHITTGSAIKMNLDKINELDERKNHNEPSNPVGEYLNKEVYKSMHYIVNEDWI